MAPSLLKVYESLQRYLLKQACAKMQRSTTARPWLRIVLWYLTNAVFDPRRQHTSGGSGSGSAFFCKIIHVFWYSEEITADIYTLSVRSKKVWRISRAVYKELWKLFGCRILKYQLTVPAQKHMPRWAVLSVMDAIRRWILTGSGFSSTWTVR